MRNVTIALAIAATYASPALAGNAPNENISDKPSKPLKKIVHNERGIRNLNYEQKRHSKEINDNKHGIEHLNKDEKRQNKEVHSVKEKQEQVVHRTEHNNKDIGNLDKEQKSHSESIEQNSDENQTQTSQIKQISHTQTHHTQQIHQLNNGQRRQNKHISHNTKTNKTQRKALTSLNTGLSQNEQVDAQTRQNLSALSSNVRNYELQTNSRIRYMNDRINHMHHQLNQVKGAIALSYAMSNNHFDLSAGAGPQLSIGGGYYSGESAGDMALGAPINRRVFVSANAGYTTTNQYGVGVGATIKLGR